MPNKNSQDRHRHFMQIVPENALRSSRSSFTSDDLPYVLKGKVVSQSSPFVSKNEYVATITEIRNNASPTETKNQPEALVSSKIDEMSQQYESETLPPGIPPFLKGASLDIHRRVSSKI